MQGSMKVQKLLLYLLCVININAVFSYAVFRRDVLWYYDVCPSVHTWFSANNFTFLPHTKLKFLLAYLCVSLGCGKISYYSDLSCSSFAPLFDNKCYI
jgi:hypothetical protein